MMFESTTHMTREALARLGTPSMVYIRTVTVAEIADEVDGVTDLPADKVLYSVHAADGRRMAVMDDHDAAMLAIKEHEMEPVSLH